MKIEKKQSFIDLGCGNGLLVYLLTMEGVSFAVEEFRECVLSWTHMYTHIHLHAVIDFLSMRCIALKGGSVK